MNEAVFFDAMGTLIYLPQSVGHHYSVVAARRGLDFEEKELDGAFRSVWKQMPARPATNGPRPDDDKGWWRELVRRVFETVAPTAVLPGFDGLFEEIYGHFAQPGVWQLYPEVAGVLAALSKRHRLGVISNFDNRLRHILGHLGILNRFEKLILSSETGAGKPDAQIFQRALEAFGVPAANALHVGDGPVHDWEAAAKVGMAVYRLQRPENSLAGLLEYFERAKS
jgi:putative hydrolase of the HAD superfamily